MFFKNYSSPAFLDSTCVDGEKHLIDGADVYDKLCPVNKLTGCRENPLSLLSSLVNDPVRGNLLRGILDELPTIASNSQLSDDDKIDMLMCRLSTGAPAEDDLFRAKLEKIAAPLFESLGADSSAEVKKVVETVDTSVSVSSETE